VAELKRFWRSPAPGRWRAFRWVCSREPTARSCSPWRVRWSSGGAGPGKGWWRGVRRGRRWTTPQEVW